MNPQSTAIEGSPDPLKARSESEIRVKILERARLKGATKGPGGGGRFTIGQKTTISSSTSFETEEVVLLGYQCQQMKVNSL